MSFSLVSVRTVRGLLRPGAQDPAKEKEAKEDADAIGQEIAQGGISPRNKALVPLVQGSVAHSHQEQENH